MSARPVSRSAAAAENGFMLVGVIMFVLVLTILGLSLFSLSSFEAQFFYRSKDQVRAFQAAMGGIERARFAISVDGELENVKSSLAPAGVTYAVAWQGDREDTTVNCWNNSDPVTILVVADVGDARERVMVNFDPQGGAGLYKRLMSLNGDLYVAVQDEQVPPRNRISWTKLNGDVRKNGASVGPWGPGAIDVEIDGNIPAPDVRGSWWSSVISPPSTTDVGGPNANNEWHFGGSSGPKFYRSTGVVGPDPDWNLFFPGQYPYDFAEIHVTGKVVWLFPHGVRFDPGVSIIGHGQDATLVIVGRKNLSPSGDEDYGTGIAFYGSLMTTGVNLILISDGDVKILHVNDWQSEDKSVEYLSIFARNAYIEGPYNLPGGFDDLNLSHDPNDSRDWADGLIDQLLDANALPNSGAGSRGTLRPIAGSWGRRTETNPN